MFIKSALQLPTLTCDGYEPLTAGPFFKYRGQHQNRGSLP